MAAKNNNEELCNKQLKGQGAGEGYQSEAYLYIS